MEHHYLDQLSIVNSVDWAYSEAQILSGSQDDMALLWDAETLENVCRSGRKYHCTVSSINILLGNDFDSSKHS